MTKTFQIVERVRLQIFSGFNNVLNHPRWAFSDTQANSPVALNVFSTSFGIINAPTGNRSINLRAVLSF